MTRSGVSIDAAEAPPELTRHYRLVALFVVHVILALAPLVAAPLGLMQPEVGLDSMTYIMIAQVNLLAFWGGFGTDRGIRVKGAILGGLAYLTVVWLITNHIIFGHPDGLVEVLLISGIQFVILLVWLIVLLLPMLIVRRKLAELRWLPDASAVDETFPWQLSIRHLFALILGAAVLLAVARYARDAAPLAWPPLFFLLVSLVNSICGIWATLSPGRTARRILFVFAASIFVGLTLSVDSIGGVLGQPALTSLAILPGVVVLVASLLVVRSCGYRLLRRGFTYGAPPISEPQ